MEFSVMEELLMAPSWGTFPNEPNDYLPNVWSSSSSYDNRTPDSEISNPSLLQLISPTNFYEEPQTFLDNFSSSVPEFCSSYNYQNENPMPIQEDIYTANLETEEFGSLENIGLNGFEQETSFFKVETSEPPINIDVSNVGFSPERKSKIKKADGRPSKNLMAERRRRKRLNDRLSMLRSIVPKISKMDRTSILGDTIDYVKELLDKINKLREEEIDENANQINSNSLQETNPTNDQLLVRNPSKFDVERKNEDTRVNICCTSKPGLLISTIGTLEALGLDIQQCVISCFNDFSLQATCHEAVEHRSVLSSEDVKQALFKNAGYGGR